MCRELGLFLNIGSQFQLKDYGFYSIKSLFQSYTLLLVGLSAIRQLSVT